MLSTLSLAMYSLLILSVSHPHTSGYKMKKNTSVPWLLSSHLFLDGSYFFRSMGFKVDKIRVNDKNQKIVWRSWTELQILVHRKYFLCWVLIQPFWIMSMEEFPKYPMEFPTGSSINNCNWWIRFCGKRLPALVSDLHRYPLALSSEFFPQFR